MKNTYILVTLLMILTLSTGCEKDLIIYNNDRFVQLENFNSISITENSGEVVEITAILGGAQPSDVNISFDVIGGDTSRYILTPSTASLVIPAGETSGTLTFEAIDNDDIDGDVEVVISLGSSSDLPVGIGGEGINAISKTITIVDDNVPCNDYLVTVTTDRWGSENSWIITDTMGATVASGGPYLDGPDGFTETYEEPVTLADGCYTFTMIDSYGDGMGTGTYSLTCGALTAASGGPTLANGNMTETTDFCVNQ